MELNYVDQHKRSRRVVIAIAATLAINGWLIYALFHGNIYPFAAPEHLIRVRIYPNGVKATPTKAPVRSAMPVPGPVSR